MCAPFALCRCLFALHLRFVWGLFALFVDGLCLFVCLFVSFLCLVDGLCLFVCLFVSFLCLACVNVSLLCVRSVCALQTHTHTHKHLV